ncbi:MAG TPA: hypothetical protein VFX98_19420, partial [Longimicrobiaceae bacterium]|nr:hypothetical protein [Longimicrobiaceae bacterium]
MRAAALLAAGVVAAWNAPLAAQRPFVEVQRDWEQGRHVAVVPELIDLRPVVQADLVPPVDFMISGGLCASGPRAEREFGRRVAQSALDGREYVLPPRLRDGFTRLRDWCSGRVAEARLPPAPVPPDLRVAAGVWGTARCVDG